MTMPSSDLLRQLGAVAGRYIVLELLDSLSAIEAYRITLREPDGDEAVCLDNFGRRVNFRLLRKQLDHLIDRDFVYRETSQKLPETYIYRLTDEGRTIAAASH
jgi:hypothetical protein